MSNSRLFVRGLPSSFREHEFRKHFDAFAPVTDVKLLPQRRIGYVGFRSDEEAARALKHFNKSYIRTSRIRVELADNALPKSQANHPTTTISQSSDQSPNTLKRKRSQEKDGTDVKWKEYRELMKPPVFNKSWEAKPALFDSKIQESTDHQNPDASDHIDVENMDGEATNKHEHVSEEEKSTRPDQHETNYQDGNELANLPASDMDWMRSRTSRLLGLLDEEEEEDHKNVINGPEMDSPKPPVPPKKESTEKLQDSELHNSINISNQASGGDQNDKAYHRLFVRNLPYGVTDEELEKHFQDFGLIEEIHVPRDPRSGLAKGFAFVQFGKSKHAAEACQTRDGTVFQGRLLHIIPAEARRTSHMDDITLSKLPLKKQRQIQKKAEASTATFSWNSLFMNADSVLSSISDRLGVAKSEILDPSSADASVKLAQAETHVIQETKDYFSANGIDLEAFRNRERDDSAVLVKNFPYGTTAQELKQLFADQGDVKQVLMPPSGTIAIIKFELPGQAKAAFANLAYRKYKESVLFLEKAPKGVFKGESSGTLVNTNGIAPRADTMDLLQPEEDLAPVETATLYVRNLNFATKIEAFQQTFQPLDGFISARIKTKTNSSRPGETLSMGFGFVEFRSAPQAQAALAALNGYVLDGHQLVIKASHKGNDAAQERRNLDDTKRKEARKSKLVIKNLPFEVSKKEVRNLFKSYGQLRAVRVPRKFDNSRKGYAFAEFSNPKEAENALVSLRNTHLLGRRLVLDYAADEVGDPEQEIKNMQRKVEKQANNVALQRLASGSERRKVNMTGEGNEDE